MDVISRLARRFGWVTQAEIEEYQKRWDDLILRWKTGYQEQKDKGNELRAEARYLKQELDHAHDKLARTEGRLTGEIQRNDDLRASLLVYEQELREIRKGLMTRMGLLPQSRENTSQAPPKPIEQRRKPWDQTRAELERDSTARLDHWVKKIEEVEAKDKARNSSSKESPAASSDDIARDVQELSNGDGTEG